MKTCPTGRPHAPSPPGSRPGSRDRSRVPDGAYPSSHAASHAMLGVPDVARALHATHRAHTGPSRSLPSIGLQVQPYSCTATQLQALSPSAPRREQQVVRQHHGASGRSSGCCMLSLATLTGQTQSQMTQTKPLTTKPPHRRTRARPGHDPVPTRCQPRGQLTNSVSEEASTPANPTLVTLPPPTPRAHLPSVTTVGMKIRWHETCAAVLLQAACAR